MGLRYKQMERMRRVLSDPQWVQEKSHDMNKKKDLPRDQGQSNTLDLLPHGSFSTSQSHLLPTVLKSILKELDT